MLAAAAVAAAASKSLRAPLLVQRKFLYPNTTITFLRSYHSPLRNFNLRTTTTTTTNPYPLTYHVKSFLSDSPSSSSGRAGNRAYPLHPVSLSYLVTLYCYCFI